MPYKKLLITLTICVGFSSNMNLNAQAPVSWSQWGTDLLYKGFRVPTALINRLSEWSTRKILLVVSAGIITLLGIYKNKNALKKWINNIIDHEAKNQEEDDPSESVEPSQSTHQPFSMREPDSPINLSQTQSEQSLDEIVTKKENESWIDFFYKLQKSKYNPQFDRFRLIKDENEAKKASLELLANILVQHNQTPIEIARLQNTYPQGTPQFPALNQALLSKYYDDYRKDLNQFNLRERPHRIRNLINELSNENSHVKQEILQSFDLGQGLLLPDVPGSFDGLNWGKGGLRYQALQSLLATTTDLINQHDIQQNLGQLSTEYP